jgi:protein-disulfide isomerase
MDLKTTLKMAAGGVALFCTGALVTALAIGRLPVSSALAQLSGRAQIEQVVHDYLLAHPDIIVEMTNRLDRQQAAEEDKTRTNALFQVGTKALVDPKVAYVEGPANAKITVAEFFDYRCPHCKASLPAMLDLAVKNKDVRIAFIERPILTPDSIVAAQAAVASRRQPGKYVPFHFALMKTAGELPKERILEIAKSVGLDTARLEKDMADPAVVAQVNQSNALADSLHFNGTPTFVINDHIVVGEVTSEELQQLIKDPKG